MEKPAEAYAIRQLFGKARKQGGFEYLYVLVRIDGMQCHDGYEDELVALRNWLKQPNSTDLSKAYRSLFEQSEPLDLLQNLLNVANGKHYNIRPFIHLKKGSGFNAVWPTQKEKVEALHERAKTSGFSELAEQITVSYRPDLIEANQAADSELKSAFSNLTQFLTELINSYFDERIEFSKGPKYIKIPRSLDVLELISDVEFGLSGLRVHFSQNCSADFIRTPKGVFGMNLEFGPPVCFLMMSMEESSNEYRVNGKRLFEVGLPGKYNQLGEWKPLIYPGKSDALVKEAADVSQDPDVQGAFLNMKSCLQKTRFVL